MQYFCFDSLSERNSSRLFLFPTCEEEITKLTYECLKTGKSAGFDDLRPSIIRTVLPFITKPLEHIFNNSLKQGIFPDETKRAKIVPIYKSGDTECFVNYRPVSVLPCLSKILERLMFNRVQSFLTKHNILFKGQYGFRSGHSTELALTNAIDMITKAIDMHEFPQVSFWTYQRHSIQLTTVFFCIN